MSSRILDSHALRLRVRDIREDGEDLRVVIEADRVGALLDGADEAYRGTGAPVEATLHVIRAGLDVFVRGIFTANVAFTCSRCLSDNTKHIELPIQWSYLPAVRFREETARDDEVELTAEDLEVSFYEGEEIDLFDMLREALVLDLGAFPACPTECEIEPLPAGVSESARDGGGSRQLDPRWLPLLELRKKQQSS